MHPLHARFLRRFPTLSSQLSVSVAVCYVFLVVAVALNFRAYWLKAQVDGAAEAGKRIASDIAAEMQHALTPVVDEAELNRIAMAYLRYNRFICIYLVAVDGSVKEQFCTNNLIVQQSRVSMEPLHRALTDPATTPLGDDPERRGKRTPISVAEVTLDGVTYYVYVTLFNQNGDHLNGIFETSMMLRTGLPLALAVALVAGVFFLLLVRLMVSRFVPIMSVVHAVRSGDYSQRVGAVGDDELATLGRAIDMMSETIAVKVAALRDNDVQRRELIANIWHDIRTPVSGLGALLQRFQTVNGEPRGESGELITRMFANLEMLTKFLSDLSDLGRLETGEIVPKIERCGITTLLDDVAIVHAQFAEARGVALTIDLPEKLPAVAADATMLSRVLGNLLQNAIRYTAPGGTVTLGGRLRDGNVEVVVRDTGAGIAPDELPRIFERSFQSKSDFEHGIGGLGLAIVKSMVEAHGSRIEVTSSVGVGTEFRFSLPVSDPTSVRADRRSDTRNPEP